VPGGLTATVRYGIAETAIIPIARNNAHQRK